MSNVEKQIFSRVNARIYFQIVFHVRDQLQNQISGNIITRAWILDRDQIFFNVKTQIYNQIKENQNE